MSFILRTSALKNACIKGVNECCQWELASGHDGRAGLAAVAGIRACVTSTSGLWPPSIFAVIVKYKMTRAYNRASWETEYSSEKACMGGPINAVEKELAHVLLFWVCCQLWYVVESVIYGFLGMLFGISGMPASVFVLFLVLCGVLWFLVSTEP